MSEKNELIKSKKVLGLPVKVYTKEKKRGDCIKIKFIYKLFNIPFFCRSERYSYSRKIADVYLGLYQQKSMTYSLNRLGQYGDSPMVLTIGEYIANSPDILSKIQNLTKNIAPSEARNILKVISRLKENYLNPKHYIDVEEVDEVAMLVKVFYFNKSIFQISSEAYVYDGYFLPENSFGASVFLYKHSMDVFESSTLQKIRKLDIIDAGAYIGDSAIVFEREFCDKKIHSFEATKTNFALMQKTLKLNDSKRIVPINKGLGSKEEQIEISYIWGGSTMNKDAKDFWDFTHTEIADVISLDSYVFANNIEVGFIKVDIEGFEQEFLKGAKETIKKFRPAMLISIYHNYDDFFNIKPLIESWDLGYTFKFHKPVDGSISIETALYCEVL